MTRPIFARGMGTSPAGPPGANGTNGTNGLPGVNAVANDTATATYISTPSSATATALSDSIGGPTTLGKVLDGATDTGATVALTGMSLMYGQRTTGSGTIGGANGAGQTRSPNAMAAVLPGFLSLLWPHTATIVNQGYPGDSLGDVLTRWSGGSSGDVEVIWCDTNEPGLFSTEPYTVAESVTNLTKVIARAQQRGAAVVVLGGAPVADGANGRIIRAYTNAHQQVAARYGATFLDVGELLRGLSTSQVWTDGIHLTDDAYGIVAARLACILGPRGDQLPHVAPGASYLPGARSESGGVVVARATSLDGQVIRLTAGQTTVIPVLVDEPCRVLVDFNSDGNSVGTGKLLYAFGAAGEAPYVYSLAGAAGNGYATVSGHALRSAGPDSVIVTCDTGTAEIERIRFVPLAPSPIAHGDDPTGPRLKVSAMTGQVVGPPRGGQSYDAAVDLDSPVSTLARLGTTYVSDVDFAVRIPGSGFAAVGLAASPDTTSDTLVGAGYLAARQGTDLSLKKVPGFAEVDAAYGVFAAGVYDGVVTMRLDGNDVVVLIDGTEQARVAADWKHYTPLVLTQAQILVRGVTVRRY